MKLTRPLLLSAGAEDLIDKMLKFNEAALKCALEEPADIFNCLDRKAKEIAPTYAAMREFGVGEFDVTPEDILVDGIVVDEAKAKSTPCKCIRYDGKDLCWSPGVIGLLRQDQIVKYCPTKEYEEKPKLVEHLNEFKKIAEETKGMPLMERIAVMRSLLHESPNEAVTSTKAPEGMYAEDEEEWKKEEGHKPLVMDVQLVEPEPIERIPEDLDTNIYPIPEEYRKKRHVDESELDDASKVVEEL